MLLERDRGSARPLVPYRSQGLHFAHLCPALDACAARSGRILYGSLRHRKALALNTSVSAPGSLDNSQFIAPLFHTARAVAQGDLEGGRAALRPISAEVWLDAIPMAPRTARSDSPDLLPNRPRSFSARLVAGAMRRDNFHCRYCGQRVVPRRVLVALSTLYPLELPYYAHYKRGTVHPIYWLVAAEADHLDPGSRGGSWSGLDNVITACAYCNTRKSRHRIEEIGWTLEGAAKHADWAGLTEFYDRLCQQAGCHDLRYHADFLRALREE